MDERKPDSQVNNEKPDLSALTSIRDLYTLSPTRGDIETDETAEVNQMIVEDFLRTLADIAISIASRKAKEAKG
jgi:hypothetical protein